MWQLGICLYEFMCGLVPFGEEIDDPYEIYELIIKKNVFYPILENSKSVGLKKIKMFCMK